MKYSRISTQWLVCLVAVFMMLTATVLLAQEETARISNLNKKVSYDADDAPISVILTTLARMSNANIVLATDTGSGDTGSSNVKKEEKKVSIHIKDVPIEQAVSLISKSAGLSYKIFGENTFLVGDKAKINEESGERSYIIQLNNIDATKMAASMGSTPGKTTVIAGQNALMYVGNPESYNQVLKMVQGFDTPQKQIEIRVRLIEVQLTSAKKYGIDWSKLNHLTTILAEDPVNQDGTGLPYQYTDETGYLPHGDPTDFQKLPEQQYFQKIDGFNDMGHFSRQLTAFDITLDWLLENNAAKLLTDTRVTSMNGASAEIHIGDSVPYVAKNTENDYQVSTTNVGIILNVTPTINKDGLITATISPEVSSIVDFIQGYLPRTKVRKITSTVTVPDGQKIILGGLLNSTLTQTTNKLPLLGDLPLIGKAFQHRVESLENSDLIIEITPRLLTGTEEIKEPKIDERLSKRLIKFEDEEDQSEDKN